MTSPTNPPKGGILRNVLIGVGALAWAANQYAFRREPAMAIPTATFGDRLAAMLGALRDMVRDPRFPALLGLIFFYRASEIHMARVLPLFAISSLKLITG
jgi:hypothetical protein